MSLEYKSISYNVRVANGLRLADETVLNWLFLEFIINFTIQVWIDAHTMIRMNVVLFRKSTMPIWREHKNNFINESTAEKKME